LKLQGYALQTKWLWLQKADNSRAWSQLPLRAEPEVLAFFRASTYTVLGDGNTSLFWEDRWLNGADVAELAPNLVKQVPGAIRRSLSVRQGLSNRDWTHFITGALTDMLIAEFFDLWDATENVALLDQPDKIVWRWTPDGQYTAKSAYSKLHTGAITFRGHALIWKT
jgi:hypothetical protein